MDIQIKIHSPPCAWQSLISRHSQNYWISTVILFFKKFWNLKLKKKNPLKTLLLIRALREDIQASTNIIAISKKGGGNSFSKPKGKGCVIWRSNEVKGIVFGMQKEVIFSECGRKFSLLRDLWISYTTLAALTNVPWNIIAQHWGFIYFFAQ